MRSLAAASDISKTALLRNIKDGAIRSHTNSIKSGLTDDNKIARLQYCLSMLDLTCPPVRPAFKSSFDYIHNDKKWFNMTKASQRYYLFKHEIECNGFHIQTATWLLETATNCCHFWDQNSEKTAMTNSETTMVVRAVVPVMTTLIFLNVAIAAIGVDGRAN